MNKIQLKFMKVVLKVLFHAMPRLVNNEYYAEIVYEILKLRVEIENKLDSKGEG